MSCRICKASAKRICNFDSWTHADKCSWASRKKRFLIGWWINYCITVYISIHVYHKSWVRGIWTLYCQHKMFLNPKYIIYMVFDRSSILTHIHFYRTLELKKKITSIHTQEQIFCPTESSVVEKLKHWYRDILYRRSTLLPNNP